MKEKRRWRQISKYILIAMGVAAATVGIIALIRIGYAYEWTGFGEYVRIKAHDQEEFQRRKTLWDWLQLLIVPIVLAIGGYIFNRTEKAREVARTEQRAQNERETTENNQREAALQTYFDRMAELVLDKNLREKSQDNAAWAVAQARTDTTLQRLDTERKARLVRFLGQAQLLNTRPSLVVPPDQRNPLAISLIQAYHSDDDQQQRPAAPLEPVGPVNTLVPSHACLPHWWQLACPR